MASLSISSRVLGIFAKWPSPGQAKTRLSPTDPTWGARVAEAFLRDGLTRFEKLEARRVLAFAPVERAADFAALTGRRYELTPQGEGDLGRRLNVFFAQQIHGDGRIGDIGDPRSAD